VGIVSPEYCVSAVGEAQAMSRLGIDVVLTRSSAVSSKGEFALKCTVVYRRVYKYKTNKCIYDIKIYTVQALIIR
jgi:hypothetical protein